MTDGLRVALARAQVAPLVTTDDKLAKLANAIRQRKLCDVTVME